MPGGLAPTSTSSTWRRATSAAAWTAPATFSLYVRDMPKQRGFLVAAGSGGLPATSSRRSSFDEDDLRVPGVDRLRRSSDRGPRARSASTARCGPCPRDGSCTRRSRSSRSPRRSRRAAGRDGAAEPGDPAHDAHVEGRPLRPRGRGPRPRRLRVPSGTRGGGRDGRGARARAIVGFEATSNVEAAREFGLRVTGTMAHSFINAFDDERDAFRAFAEDHPTPDHVPRRHVRHVERRPERDRGDPRAAASRARSGSGWTRGDLDRLSREARRDPRPRRPRPREDLRQRRARRASRSRSWSGRARPSTRSGSAPSSGSRPTRRTWTRSTSSCEFDGRPVLKLSPGEGDRARAQAGLARAVGGRDRAPRRGGARPEPRAAAGAGDAGRAPPRARTLDARRCSTGSHDDLAALPVKASAAHPPRARGGASHGGARGPHGRDRGG